MKKSNRSKLITIALAGIIALSGCTNIGQESGGSENNTDKKYIIGISQFADHPALDDARKGFEDGLKELGVNAEIQYQNSQGDIPNSLAIAQKFVKDEVDLIYAIATPAAQSAKQATDEIPVLFSAVTDPVEAGIVEDWDNVGGNVTGTSDQAPVLEQLKMFKELDSNIESIGILYNTSEANSEIQIENVKNFAPDLGLKVVELGISNVNEMPQALDSLLSKVDAVYGLSDNLVVSSIELVTKKLLENNKISVGTEESQVGGGILITNGLSYYELGKQTATMAKEILIDKKDISTIPVGLAEKTTTIINQESWEALGLDTNMQIYIDAEKIGN